MRLLITALACFLLFSCNKYEEGPVISLLSAQQRLIGQWDVVEINDSISAPLGILPSGQTWEFEQDGDFNFSTNWLIPIWDCGLATTIEFPEYLVGEWEFEANKEKIEIGLDSMPVLVELGGLELPSPFIPSGEFDIIRLTNHELWLEIGNDRIEFEKID